MFVLWCKLLVSYFCKFKVKHCNEVDKDVTNIHWSHRSPWNPALHTHPILASQVFSATQLQLLEHWEPQVPGRHSTLQLCPNNPGEHALKTLQINKGNLSDIKIQQQYKTQVSQEQWTWSPSVFTCIILGHWKWTCYRTAHEIWSVAKQSARGSKKWYNNTVLWTIQFCFVFVFVCLFVFLFCFVFFFFFGGGGG